MRTLFIAAVVLLAGSMATEMTAQNAIAAVVKKCESMKDVNINKVRSRDKDSKELTREITNIMISNNPALVNEIVAAFAKDGENALHSSESSSNGKVTSIFYRFENASYSFSQSDDGNATVTVITGEGKATISDMIRNGGAYYSPNTPESKKLAEGILRSLEKDKKIALRSLAEKKKREERALRSLEKDKNDNK